MGYLPAEKIQPLFIVETIAEKKITTSPIIVGISKIKAPNLSGILQKCKTMQGLNYILAKIAAKKSGHFDDILLSEKGFVSECSSSNIFWVKNNKIFTSSAKCNILFGTTRDKILKKFPIKINLVEARLSRLKNADEIFLTNSNFLALAVDELVTNNKKIKLQKNLSSQVLQWLENDIEKYKCHQKNKN